jgi:hypothetical protein
MAVAHIWEESIFMFYEILIRGKHLFWAQAELWSISLEHGRKFLWDDSKALVFYD